MKKIIEMLRVENEEQAIQVIQELLLERERRVFCIYDDKGVFISDALSIGHIFTLVLAVDALKKDTDALQPWKKPQE